MPLRATTAKFLFASSRDSGEANQFGAGLGWATPPMQEVYLRAKIVQSTCHWRSGANRRTDKQAGAKAGQGGQNWPNHAPDDRQSSKKKQ